jgi:mannose-6-phosphate isomerase-like protein (cupin superfamily)
MKEVKKIWGGEKHFVFNTQCTVKLLEVNPHQMLSLQYHHLRAEEWYFLTDGFVQIGMEKRKVKKGDLVKIKKGQAHRLISEKKKVQVLEISYGKFKQSDIVRIEDKYGRAR